MKYCCGKLFWGIFIVEKNCEVLLWRIIVVNYCEEQLKAHKAFCGVFK